MRAYTLLFLYMTFCVTLSSPPNFLSVGDWGSAALGGYHLRNAHDTSSAMKAYIAEKVRLGQDPPSFVLNTGDNFYYCGIQNTSDPQISEDYTALFGGMGLSWYHSLGNHDYGFSPEAQLALNSTIPGWIMDARYYHRRISISPTIIANIIVLDTNPCVRDYRGSDRRRWDPCGIQYPDCSPFAEPCRFHENIIAQDCDAQLVWARQTLDNITTASTSTSEWIFVVGHHKAEEIDAADFQSAFLDDPRVHLYLNGHTHNLEHYEINGQAKYMTTGAGGMVIIGGDGGGGGGGVAERLSPHHHRQSNHTNIRSIWSKIVTGFTSHTFMNDGTALRTEFWDAKKNETVYSFEIHL
jgi:hypothetical protein